jgi:hypothetical protein
MTARVHRVDRPVIAHRGNRVVLRHDPHPAPRASATQHSAKRGVEPRDALSQIQATVAKPPHQVSRARMLLMSQLRMPVHERNGVDDGIPLSVDGCEHVAVREGHGGNANAERA